VYWTVGDKAWEELKEKHGDSKGTGAAPAGPARGGGGGGGGLLDADGNSNQNHFNNSRQPQQPASVLFNTSSAEPFTGLEHAHDQVEYESVTRGA
jgi:hypothetical protein